MLDILCGVSPVRFRGLSGSRGWRLGDGGGAGLVAGRLGERGVGRSAGRLRPSGPMRVRAWTRCRGSDLLGDEAGDFSTCGVLEWEETLQDLRRGNDSVGCA